VTDRLLLVASSPRLPGLLSAAGWDALRAGPVFTADEATEQAAAVRAAGIEVTPLSSYDDRGLASAFREHARGATAVWLAGPDGDPGFARALGDLLARTPQDAELEVVYGSWDPPGARLLDVVAVMDRLRSPGGCPWDAEQTHASLAPYLLEEAYEAYAALEDDDPVALREELGDVLLQVVFHARLAEEDEDTPWSVDDVAGGLVDKLVRRHPHVFAGRAVSGVDEVLRNWDELKAEEKARTSVTDGVPLGQPALTLAATLQRKAAKLGLPADLLEPPPGLGGQLFTVVAEARARGEDPEVALRTVSRTFRDRLAAVERAALVDGTDPATLGADQWRARWAAAGAGS